ncbi:hypothetical protein [Prosthecobacter debontii]|uniref:hypothetical protein n=1 Tax=Prosthecobacter debontii TaxID=48467 RepID=UPI0015917DF3|nr:hypothetical protein [Prosthecobacter debontii]
MRSAKLSLSPGLGEAPADDDAPGLGGLRTTSGTTLVVWPLAPLFAGIGWLLGANSHQPMQTMRTAAMMAARRFIVINLDVYRYRTAGAAL